MDGAAGGISIPNDSTTDHRYNAYLAVAFEYLGDGSPGGTNLVSGTAHLFRVQVILGAAYRYLGSEIEEHVTEELLDEADGIPYATREYTSVDGKTNASTYQVTADWQRTERITDGVSVHYARTTVETTVVIRIERRTFTLTYDANGGGSAPLPTLFRWNDSVNLTRQVRRRGYKLVGWDTDSTARWPRFGTTYFASTPADVKLYAIWTCIYTYLPVRSGDDTKLVTGANNIILRHGDENI